MFMVWRAFCYFTAFALIVLYVVFGVGALRVIDVTPQSPASFFLMLPLWPTALFCFYMVTDPIGMIEAVIPYVVLGVIVIGGGIGAGKGYGVGMPTVRYIYWR